MRDPRDTKVKTNERDRKRSREAKHATIERKRSRAAKREAKNA